MESHKYEIITGNYVSEGNPEIRSVETPLVMEFAQEFKTLTVDKYSTVEIIIEENPCLTVFEWTKDGETNEVTIKDNKITVPAEMGVYI
ncbi:MULTISPECIES: hypothetical protein [Virgibacillus]|uniref:Uncharacterized protein n=1 Tax=Virgibacillus dokdonensis TaxID=302167 RepID=A0A2K9J6W9_9BACI|nr:MULTISPECIES: hypothetical protein [Virgibacillus]AUJ26071.1 hypothetical protein A21D_03029 [Virgibacillus dokdonensis]NWO14545.1 hypothetical protein [Virgibacillus sp.]